MAQGLGKLGIAQAFATGGGGVTPPTRVTGSATVWNTVTTPKTLSITTQTGDQIVVVGMGSNWSNSGSDLTISGGSLTWTQQQSNLLNSYSQHHVWTATASGNATFNIQVVNPTGAGGNPWGFAFEQWRGSSGIGASAKGTAASGAPTVALTTLHANSAIVLSNADWVPQDGASRTFASVNGSGPTDRVYFRDGSVGAFYVATYADAGAAGAKSPGITAPGGQKYSAIAVEVRGT